MGWFWRIGFILCSLALVAPPCYGRTEVFFTSQQSVEEKMVRLIERADTSIDMALFELRSARLASMLTRAKERGVRVRLILDAEHAKEDLAAGEVRLLGGKNMRGRGVMHHKFAVFDRKKVVTGSFNWTPGAEHANYENALLIDDAGTVSAYGREFETLWRRALVGPPPNGMAVGTNALPRRSIARHTTRNRLKFIRIRVPKPVIKCRRKAHTNRP